MQTGETDEHSSGAIERFLDALSLDGFSIGVRESLKVHQLSGILTERNVSLEGKDSRAMFTALIARDPAEQRRVADLYDSTFNEMKLSPLLAPTPYTAVAPPPDPKLLGQFLAAFAALVVLVVFVLSLSKTPVAQPETSVTASRVTNAPGTDSMSHVQPLPVAPVRSEWTTDGLYRDLDRLMGENKLPAAPTLREMQKAGWPPKEGTGGVQLHLPALVQRLQLSPDWPIDLNAESTRRRIMSAFVEFGIAARLPLRMFEEPDVKILSGILFDISPSIGTFGPFAEEVKGLSQSKRIELAGDSATLSEASRDRTVSADLIDRAIAIRFPELSADKNSFTDASWKPQPPSAVTTAPAWLRPSATAAPLLVAALWFLGLANHRRSRISRKADAHSPLDHRLVLEAPVNIQANRTDKAYLTRVAASLSVRQSAAALSFDPERTVRASIAAGGVFTLVRGRIASTPAYLLFVEARCAGDQEARRLEMLHRRLADAGVNVKRFFYFDSPAWLHDDFDGDPQPIEDVAAHYEDRRLIILGEGRGFLTPLSNAPQPWANILAVWPQRAMLTPRPLKEWGPQEFAIARALGLPLGRATVEGLFALAELLGLDEGRDRPLFRAYGFTGGFDLKPMPALICSRPYYWLSENDPGEEDATRLDGVLRYYLDAEGLLWLKALAVYPALQWDLTLYLGRELRLFEEPRLAALTLLPWLREGHMPLWLRKRFIASISDDIRTRTITAIHRLMAADEESARLAMLRADPMRRPSLRGREPSRDGLFLETLANEGDFLAPAWMKPRLRSWLATLSFRELGVALVAGLFSTASWWLAPTPQDGALGPGAFMPLTALGVLPALSWLGLAWFEDRLHVPAWLVAWWEELSKPATKEEMARRDDEFEELQRRIKFWWRRLISLAAEKAGDGRRQAEAWLSSANLPRRSRGDVGSGENLTAKDWDETEPLIGHAASRAPRKRTVEKTVSAEITQGERPMSQTSSRAPRKKVFSKAARKRLKSRKK